MKKRILLYGIIITIRMWPQMLIYSYYESDFFCSFSNANLIITQNAHNGWRNCLDLISYLLLKKSEITSSINIVKEDSAYNKSAKLKLIKQRTEMDSLYTKTVQWVIDLESQLFLSYKKKYLNKIKPIRSKLITKQAVLSTDLLISIREGKRELVKNITKTIGFNYQRIKLIEWIITSKSLDEMMPLLQTYESIITEYIQWKSE